MKKTILLLLALALCVGLLAACDKDTAADDEPESYLEQCPIESVTVGGHTVTGKELGYFYRSITNHYSDQNDGTTKYTYNMYVALDQQYANGDKSQTWQEYFVEKTVERIKLVYTLYDQALAAGYGLTEQQRQELKEYVSSRGTFSSDAALEEYASYLEFCTVAGNYYDAYVEQLEITDEDLSPQQGYTYTYGVYNIHILQTDVGTGGFASMSLPKSYDSDEELLAAIQAAQTLAQTLASGSYSDLEEFEAAAEALDPEYTSISGSSYIYSATVTTSVTNDIAYPGRDSNFWQPYGNQYQQMEDGYEDISTLYRDWLAGESDGAQRQLGDTAVFQHSILTDEGETVLNIQVVCYGDRADSQDLQQEAARNAKAETWLKELAASVSAEVTMSAT